MADYINEENIWINSKTNHAQLYCYCQCLNLDFSHTMTMIKQTNALIESVTDVFARILIFQARNLSQNISVVVII